MGAKKPTRGGLLVAVGRVSRRPRPLRRALSSRPALRTACACSAPAATVRAADRAAA